MMTVIRRDSRTSVVAFLSALTIGALPAGANAGAKDVRSESGGPSPVADASVSITVPLGEYEITPGAQGDRVSADDFGYLLVPGKPKLPSRIVAVAIPPGAEVVKVSYAAGGGVTLPGTYDVRPTPLHRAIGAENPDLYRRDLQTYQDNYDSVYGSDDVYPSQVAELVRSAGYRKYNLVDVRITPFAYRPLTGRLTCYPKVTVQVSYRFSEDPRPALVDNMVRTELVAGEIIFNYEQTREWYAQDRSGSRSVSDYVIITLDSLTSAVAGLADWETTKGRSVSVVTTSWIDAEYSGYDLAEKMRNFLRDKYPAEEWGIQDVLLVGHYDDVPMRRTWQDMGYGKPETDFYYAELSLPDDESWDADGDHNYGEDSDPIDFYAEVNVGRIPWSDPTTVSSICDKSIAYELNDDPAFKKNMLLLGSFYWSDTDNAVLMELKANQLWMADWTMTRMYEQNPEAYSAYDCDYPLIHENVMSVWPAGQYAFVNWAGHGSPTAAYIMGLGSPAFISASDCPALNDDYPAIIFAAACSNSDTDELNIGQAMMQQGAVGFLGATKVAYGFHDWDDPYDGATASMDYFFTTSVTSGNYTQGAGHQWALREMYTNGLWYYDKYETFEWGALWGNPNLGMTTALILGITLPDGTPDYLDPGAPTTITVEIEDGTEAYVPGSGTLHYRFDGGTFLAESLTALGGGLYEATLPGGDCDATAEFYFSATGDGGTTVYHPADAPASLRVAKVGFATTILDDDFETDLGWTVENVDLLAGAWERGVPAGDGTRGDPLADFDGSGQCYLTGNELGNSDVDGGPTRLISPTFDLSGASNAALTYARWYTCDDDLPPAEDFLVVEASNDGGASWMLLETVPSTVGWVEKTVYIKDEIAPAPLTTQMVIRFSVTDNPNDSKTEAGIDAVEILRLTCAPPGTGDFDGDGDVDLDDFARFPDGLAGPGATPAPSAPFSAEDYLAAFDFDVDADVDLNDFAQFQVAFGD